MKKLFIGLVVIGTLLVSCTESTESVSTKSLKGWSPETDWVNIEGVKNHQFEAYTTEHRQLVAEEEWQRVRFTDSADVVFFQNKWQLLYNVSGYPSSSGTITMSDNKTYKYYRVDIHNYK